MKAWGEPRISRSLDPTIRLFEVPPPDAAAIPIDPIDPLAGPQPGQPVRSAVPLEETEGTGVPAAARALAESALLGLAAQQARRTGIGDPLVSIPARFATGRASNGGGAPDVAPILAAWRHRAEGPTAVERRYPWELGHDAAPNDERYTRPDRRRGHWRPREADSLDRDPTGYGHRLLAPIVLAEVLDFLGELAETAAPPVADVAAWLRTEYKPRMEGDAAGAIQGDDPWRDTMMLWQLARRPRALAELHPLAIAIATRYATLALRMAGLVCGTRHPFESVPLVSASAHLGLGLWSLRLYPSLVPGLLEFVAARRTPDGGWADDGQAADVLTTLAAAELALTLDPSFDPEPTARFLASHQEREGWWRALDPEVPWLTAAVLGWLEAAERPFAERFRWPGAQRRDLDRKTQVPSFGYFDDLVRSFGALPGLRGAPVEIAFCDLAGFKGFNDAYGQRRGDDVLRVLSAALRDVPATVTVRDGGDEFLIVGPPTGMSLEASIRTFLAEWPSRFAAAFPGVEHVVRPRVLLAETTGGRLMDARDALGFGIGRLKQRTDLPVEAMVGRIDRV